MLLTNYCIQNAPSVHLSAWELSGGKWSGRQKCMHLMRMSSAYLAQCHAEPEAEGKFHNTDSAFI